MTTRLAAAAALLVMCCSAARAEDPWRWEQRSRIVVVADVHGAYAELAALLRATGIIDDARRWSGGDAMLVSLGDVVDRGAQSRQAIDLLMRLQREAEAQGGAVHVLLGNHEAMNLTGDLRYVSAEEYAAFAAEEPASVREAAYESFRSQHADAPPATVARELAQRYPPGFFGHRLAFAADGTYGRWLASLPALIVVGDTAFVHGGLSRWVAAAGGAQVNEAVRSDLRRHLAARQRLAEAGILPRVGMGTDVPLAEQALRALPAGGAASDDLRPLIETFLDVADSVALGAEGPLWYRGSVYCNPFLEAPVLEAALERLGARRVVVGHTPTADRRVRELHGGRLIMLDTGMLRPYYSGRPAALVIEDDEVTVQYLEPTERQQPEGGAVEAYGLAEKQLIEALLAGEIDAGDSAGRVQVRHAGNVIEGVFYAGRAGDRELAAHALDRLLGLRLVPPTVPRIVNGRSGALQLRYPNAVTERERLDGGVALEPWCPIEPQARLMQAFDVLIHNTGRSADNVVFRRESAVMKLVDHGRAFGAERRLLAPVGASEPALVAALASLDEDVLEDAVGAWLDDGAIRGVLARRDAMLAAAGEPGR